MTNYVYSQVCKGGIEVKLVLASISPHGIPLYTFEIYAPKFLDAEFEKHRMLSSNSSSSRAIPYNFLEDVFIPPDVRKPQKGMQGYKEVDDDTWLDFHEDLKNLLYRAESLGSRYKEFIHKQHLNRYREAWMFQRKVLTGTEWNNFFRLRTAKDADPSIQIVAHNMWVMYNDVTCKELIPGEWHTPYALGGNYYVSREGRDASGYTLSDALQSSVAGCARVSYGTVGGKGERGLDRDRELYSTLLTSGHMTPFEHQAKAMETPVLNGRPLGFIDWEDGVTHVDKRSSYWSGNFRGWVQHRQLVQEWNV